MSLNGTPRGRAHAWIRNHIVGLVALCVAMSGTAVAATDSGKNGPEASAAVVTDKKFKKLKRKVNNLEDQITALGQAPSPASPVIPTTLPPSGPAGGDLTGTYPNPLIGPGAVGAAQLGNIIVRFDQTANIANGAGGSLTVNCESGEKLISGGARLAGSVADNAAITASRAVFSGTGANDVPTGGTVDGWRAAGFVEAGGPLPLRVWAYCLQP